MWNDGQYILWQHIAQLVYQDAENGLKLLPRITCDHIRMNSYSTMRVNVAAVMRSLALQMQQQQQSCVKWWIHSLIALMSAAQQSTRGKESHFLLCTHQWMTKDLPGWTMTSLDIWGTGKRALPTALDRSLIMPEAVCLYPGKPMKDYR